MGYYFHDNFAAFTAANNAASSGTLSSLLNTWVYGGTQGLPGTSHPNDAYLLTAGKVTQGTFFENNAAAMVNNEFTGLVGFTPVQDNGQGIAYLQTLTAAFFSNYTNLNLAGMEGSAVAFLTNGPALDAPGTGGLQTLYDNAAAVVDALDPQNAQRYRDDAELRQTNFAMSKTEVANVFTELAKGTQSADTTFMVHKAQQYRTLLADNAGQSSDPNTLTKIEHWLESTLRGLVAGARYQAFKGICQNVADQLKAGKWTGSEAVANFATEMSKLPGFGPKWFSAIKVSIGILVGASAVLDGTSGNVEKTPGGQARLAGDILYGLGLYGFLTTEIEAFVSGTKALMAKIVNNVTGILRNFGNALGRGTVEVATNGETVATAAANVGAVVGGHAATEVAAATSEATSLFDKVKTFAGKAVGPLFAAGDIAIGVGAIVQGSKSVGTHQGNVQIANGSFGIAAGVCGLAMFFFPVYAPVIAPFFVVFTAVGMGLSFASAILDVA